jgi:hypothetical protein
VVGDETEVPTEHPSAAGPAVSAGPETPEPTIDLVVQDSE